MKVQQRILDFLIEQHFATGKEIEKNVSGKTKAIYQCLEDLVRQEKIERIGSGGKGDPFRYKIIKLVEAKENISDDIEDVSDLMSENAEAEVVVVNEISKENFSAKNNEFFKEYRYPNGEILRLSEKEFDDIVNIFRTLDHWGKVG